MTRLEQLTMSWSDRRLLWYIDCEEVTKDQLETIIDDWLILDEGQFDMYPDATTLYVRKFHLNSILFFSSSKKIVHDRLIFIDELHGGYYRYLVKDEVAKTNTTNRCSYETPCGWCAKWDKKCDKKIGCDTTGVEPVRKKAESNEGLSCYKCRNYDSISSDCLDCHPIFKNFEAKEITK